MLDLQLSTIVFQILNFLILVVVLTRFFYQPVLRVMKAREEAIAARLRAADERGREAEAERQRLAGLEEEAVARADALLAAARADAQETAQRGVEQARQEAATLLDEARRAVDERERAALARVEAQVRDTAVSLAGSLIRQAAGPAVHQGLLDQFLRDGLRLSGPEAEALRQAVAAGDARLTIEVAYPPTVATEARLRETISRGLGLPPSATPLPIATVPALLAGLRILAAEFALDFSLRRTLQELQQAPVDAAEQELR
jgi:F-type H+-transporting ATPase subunit b